MADLIHKLTVFSVVILLITGCQGKGFPVEPEPPDMDITTGDEPVALNVVDVTPPWLNMSPETVVFHDGYMILGGRQGIYFYDVAESGMPEYYGFLELTEEKYAVVNHVLIVGNYIYAVSSSGYEFYIVEFNSRDDCTLLSTVSMWPGPKYVSVIDDYLFAFDEIQLTSFDISDRTNPVELDYFPIYGTHPILAGEVMYTLNSYGELAIIDLHHPLNPSCVATFPVSGSDPTDLAISDGYAYVTSYGSVDIFDLSDPYLPVIVKSVDIPVYPLNISIDGNRAVVTNVLDLIVLDIESPEEAEIIGKADMCSITYTENGSIDLALSGDVAAVVYEEHNQLYLVDVGDPDSAGITGGIESVRSGGFDIEGDYLYSIRGRYMNITDISEPENARLIATNRMDTESIGPVDVAGNIAYTIQSHDLITMDVSMPGDPVVLGSIDVPGNITDIFVYDGIAYCLENKNKHLILFNVIDPGNPELLSDTPIDDSWGFYDLRVSGNYVYLCASHSGLNVLDISNPWCPVIVDIENFYNPRAVEIHNGLLFLLNRTSEEDREIHVLDLSDPAHPEEIQMFMYERWEGPTDIFITDGCCYLGFEDDTVKMMDITRPGSMYISHSGEADLFYPGIMVSDDHLYNINHGIRIYQLR